MTGALHQVNLTYSSEEDRILLRLSTSARQEYRLWLTRRFVRALWQVLIKASERMPGIGEQTDEDVRKALVSFQHAAAVRDADFKTAYKSRGFETPFGDEPVLLTGAQLKTSRSGAVDIALQTEDKRTVSVRLEPKLLYSFCSLLTAAAQKADWTLELSVGAPLAAPPSDQARVH